MKIMTCYFLKLFYALLLLLFHAQANCIHTERQALLNFIQGLDHSSGMLSSWTDDQNNGDCCKWNGIKCNNQTGHLQMLILPGLSYAQRLRGPINISLLIDLHHMEYLDLSNNYFYHSQIPESIGLFPKLKYLNLSYSAFGGMIPSEIGNLSQLRYLDLGRNYFLSGAIPSQIGNLKKLQYLDLRKNNLSGAIPFVIGNLPLLHTLRLGGNFDIKPKDAEWLSNLYSLKSLEFSSNGNHKFSHDWLQTISKLIPSLRELRLVDCGLLDNNISSLFHSHSNFSTSLTILDLSYNKLTSSVFQLLFNYSHNLHELYLSYNNIALSSPIYPNFSSLTILDLSHNLLTSYVFQSLFNFSHNLQELRLSDNNILLSSPVYPNFASLTILDLSYNELTSSVFQLLFNFTTNLHRLDLSNSFLEGPIPDGFSKVMSSLEVLQLSSNELQGQIPASLGNLCTLQTLDLSYNNLSGEIFSFIQNFSWCNRVVLQTLDLSNNWITGMLPNLSTLASLRTLDLSNNQLIGEIPESIGQLYELQSLHLEENYLEGDIIESHLTNLSKLVELDLTANSLSLKFGSGWVPRFQLFILGLASCQLGPSFPSWLQTQSHLSFLDISHAGIHDTVPDWFWNKLLSMSWLNMSYNNLKGVIPNLPLQLADYSYIILNSNQFEGGIPLFLSQASTLDLSENKISDVNTFLCGKGITTNMQTLDLSSNQIMGQLPDCWEHLNSLRFLDLSNNELSGKIPLSMNTLVNLEALVLRNNNLVGELPSTLKSCISLVILDVGENFFHGPIPSWIGESLQQLKILSLRVNSFFGSVPVHLCYLREIHLLDLSRNNLSKEIPTCLKNFTAMMERSIITTGYVMTRKMSSKELYHYTYDSNVLLTWKDQESVYWHPEILLKSIDLSSNNLTGEIPKEVAYLAGLVSLNLSRNSLSGEIPSEIGNLSSLDFLDLSRNNFSGRIPPSLTQIDDLGKLDLSHNSLCGRIPSGRHFQTFDASSFEGNPNLCGEQINKSCPGDQTTVKPLQPVVYSDDHSIFYGALYMSFGIGYFTGFWSFLGPILLCQPWRNAYLRFLNKVIDYIFVMVTVNVAKCHKRLKG